MLSEGDRYEFVPFYCSVVETACLRFLQIVADAIHTDRSDETRQFHSISLHRPYSICRIWIQIHNESGFGFTGKSNGLDS